MRSRIDYIYEYYISNNILLKLLLLSIIQLIVLIVFKEHIKNVIYFIFVIDLIKLYDVIFKEKRLTSPIFFISVAFIFWLSLGNFLNVLLHKYTNENHYYYITFLVIISYSSFLFGSMLANKIKVTKFERQLPYLPQYQAYYLLYFIVFISFIGGYLYNLPVIKAIITNNYFGNRINMLYGRGYLGAIGSLHSYVIPYIIMVKFSKKQHLSIFIYLLVFISFVLTLIPLNRGPILAFFITYLFVFNDFKKVIPIKKMVTYGTIAVLSFGVFLPIIRGHKRNALEILRNEIGIHTWNLSHYIGMTEQTGYFGLKPITMALSILLPGHQEDFVIWIKQFSTINVHVGGASLSLIGEGFLEGGLMGVILNFTVLGLISVILYKKRYFSYGAYFFFLYFLNRTESIIQFGFAKVLLTMIIVSFVLFFINLFKPNEGTISTA